LDFKGKEMNDSLAIQAIAQQNPKGLEYLMDQYGLLILRLVRRVLGSDHPGDIEECANDVWMAVWFKAPQYEPAKASVKTWICLIARSKAIDRMRKIWRSVGSTFSLNDERMPELQAEMLELQERIENREDLAKRAAELTQALTQMNPDERSILIRRYFYREDIAELASSLGVARAAMDNRLSRARKQLLNHYLRLMMNSLFKGRRANKTASALDIWDRIDPDLLDDVCIDQPKSDGSMDPIENEQDARLARQIKAKVLAHFLVKASSVNAARTRSWLHRYAKTALVAAAVVIIAGVAVLLTGQLQRPGAKPKDPAITSLPTQPTMETTVSPTIPTSTTDTTQRPTWPAEMLVPVKQYGLDLACYMGPKPGHVLITMPVDRAIDDPANQDRIFFVAIGFLSPELYANPVDQYVYKNRTIRVWGELVDLSDGTYPYNEYNGDHGGNVTREEWIQAQAEARTLDAKKNHDAAMQEYQEKIGPVVAEGQAKTAASEMERLTQLGYDVFSYTTWDYSGPDLTKENYSVTAALLTKDQLVNFPALADCGYYIDWVHCGDGLVNWEG
jgi:RNA polymerase sigma-70 factor, ECF subfamily